MLHIVRVTAAALALLVATAGAEAKAPPDTSSWVNAQAAPPGDARQHGIDPYVAQAPVAQVRLG